MQNLDALDAYILEHIDEEGEYLHALYRDTQIKLLYPRMASGHLQGRLLKMLVQFIGPKRILELGTYSGYSAILLSALLGVLANNMSYPCIGSDWNHPFPAIILMMLLINTMRYKQVDMRIGKYIQNL